VELLRGCQLLAEKLAATGGLSAPLDGGDEHVLQGFHLVQQAFAGSGDTGAFEQVCRQAGVLAGRVQTLSQEREPVLYEAEAYVIISQWHENKERGQEERSRTHEFVADVMGASAFPLSSGIHPG
jgi:hypothetical protein